MEQSNTPNKINVYTSLSTSELKVSTPDIKQVISATNNRAQYYAEQAKKYRDEAKAHRDNAKYYSEQNSDVTFEYIENVKLGLENKLELKQNIGDYALSSDIPTKVSAFENDALYVNKNELNSVVDELRLPEQEGNEGKFLQTNGEDLSWEKIPSSYYLFDTKLSDHILTYEESKGWALQGTYVYKDAIAGSRYGYPDFYNKVIEEKESAAATEVTLGDTAITMYIHSNGHQYYDIADKEIVDSWFNTYGTAWFYGVDTENERIYLPRNNYFEQTTGEISEVGQSVEAGLPNITGWTNGEETDAGGAFYHEKALTGGCNNGSNKYEKINFDASLSNPIYGNSDTVQPNAVKKLLYICVGNTETVSSITDVVDVTTAENDITPLFTGMYFDFTPNNVSWLKAGVQANSAGIYTTCYNELVNVLNGEIKYGDLKVVDTADMIAGVDYSEYWKVNQDDMTFTTPTAISNKALSGAVKGNGMTLGLTNGSEYGGLRLGTTNNTALIDTSLYGTQVGTSESTSSSLTRDISIGVTTDPTKSGIIAEQSIAQLYFKVANAVQNLELLNAGEVMEAVADKISRQDCKAYIQETYQNGTSWYRVYSDGWCEQGGNFQNATKISYIKQFKDINYILSVNPHWNNNNAVYWCDLGYAKTTTDFSIKQQTNTALTYDWQASGYIA